MTPTVNFLDLLRSGTHFAEERGDYVYILESKTGVTLAIQPKKNPGATLSPKTLEDGSTLWCEPDFTPRPYLHHEAVYSPITLDIICQRIAEGMSITDICKTQGMPTYSTLTRWRRLHPEVQEALAQARIDRAEAFRDKAVKEAASAEGKDPISGPALRVDTYKWAASVDDPQRYSQKAKIEAQINMPTQIIVETGIRREHEAHSPITHISGVGPTQPVPNPTLEESK